VSLTDRDRKIIFALIPLLVIGAYWFLLLAPKRQEASKVRDELTQAQGVRDTAQQKASQLAGAKRSFAADYATVIRLGKSIPTNVDMPSLLVQLDRAARGTGIKFADVKAGTRVASSTPAPASTTAPGGTPGGGNSGPTAPGAAPAQSGPGQAAQTASGAVASANGSPAATAGGAAGATGGAAGAAGTTAPGLESVPLDFEFRGSFFQMANFFHRMKRFVRVANSKLVIRGRLMTIDSFTFDSASGFPQIKAAVTATVYLAPKAQGVDAGATPQGPAGSAPATNTPQTASSSSLPTPTATVTSR
jgi:Tfp pilus assembly protein PilO